MKAIILLVILVACFAQDPAPYFEGGLHDYIFRLPRETLVSWALTCEKYSTETKNQFLIGGLHDYIGTISKSDLVSYILKKVDEFPELNNQDKLNALASGYGFSPSSRQASLAANPRGRGGLEDYVFRLPREELIGYALASETYSRNKKHLHLLGGLNDYISRLSNQEISDYILKSAKEFPELNNLETLKTLVNKYQIDAKNFIQPEVNVKSPIRGGDLLSDLPSVPRDVLNNYAIAAEKYHREKLNLTLLGGLHDFINTLTNQQVIEYITQEVKEHPELNSKSKVTELVSQYKLN